MKHAQIIILVIVVTFFYCCEKSDPTTIPTENFLGGDTNITLGQVGNTFNGNLKVGNNYYNTQSQIRITDNQEGVVTANFKSNLSQIPELSSIRDITPPSFIDDEGKIDFDLKFKITSNGIQDYNNDDGYAHTIVDYNSVVGSAYSIRHSDGTVHTRQVTAKSDQDDFTWGNLMIKTMTIEQNAPVPGVSKYVIRANHRFGLVYFEIQLEDGTSISTPIYPTYY